MDGYAILWFVLGWILSAITPLVVHLARFGSLLVKGRIAHIEMLNRAREKSNGRFKLRQNEIKDILTTGGVDNDETKDRPQER